MCKSKINPKDVPGKAINDMTMEKVDMVLYNLTVYKAFLEAKKYAERFRDKKWCKTVEELSNEIRPGAICSIPLVDHLVDRRVGVDDPSRISHPNGALSDKIRTVIVLRVTDFELFETTAFGSSERFPWYKIQEYLVLAHTSDGENPEVPNGMPTVRYRGKRHLTKTSYFRYTRRRRESFKNTRMAVEGYMEPDDLVELADIAGLAEDHPLRVQAEREQEERDEAEALAYAEQVAREREGQRY